MSWNLSRLIEAGEERHETIRTSLPQAVAFSAALVVLLLALVVVTQLREPAAPEIETRCLCEGVAP